MTSTELRPQPVRPGVLGWLDASTSGRLRNDLERFWPSRRGHAFDEFCR